MASQRYLQLLKDMEQLHIKKNSGYAGKDNPDPWANFRLSEGFGVSAERGCLVRMSDKFIRVQNLMKDPTNDQVGENIKDTLFDLASYALITICLIEELEKQKITSEIGNEIVEVRILKDTRDKYFNCQGVIIPKDSYNGQEILSSTEYYYLVEMDE